MRDEKLHAVVARSTFRSQKCKKLTVSDHFWKWQCRKSTSRVARRKFPSQNVQAHQGRSTFGSWDVKKVYAVVARRRFGSQNLQSIPGSEHVRKLRCWKSARHFGAKHFSKSKGYNHHMLGPLLKVQVWFHTLLKVSKTWRFCSISTNDGRRGTFQEDLQRCISRDRRRTRDMFIRDVRSSGRWFREKGCILEHQIFSFGKMILRDGCSTSYDLASLFRGRRSTLDRWSAKIAKRIGTRPSALHSTFRFWRKSLRIVSFSMLSTSKTEEVWQNCFVFDVVKFKNWGSLADLFRFLACR